MNCDDQSKGFFNMPKLKQSPSSMPPFYATMSLTAPENKNPGQHSDALASLTSSAFLKNGFIGIDEAEISQDLPVKVVYFETYEQLSIWLEEAKDLIPYSVKVEDVVCKIGCLWHWLDLNSSTANNNNQIALRA